MNNRLLTLCINTDLIVLLSVTDGLEEKHGTYLYLRPFCFLVDCRLLSGRLDATITYRYVPCNRKGINFKIPFNAAPSKHQHIKSFFQPTGDPPLPTSSYKKPTPIFGVKALFPAGWNVFCLVKRSNMHSSAHANSVTSQNHQILILRHPFITYIIYCT